MKQQHRFGLLLMLFGFFGVARSTWPEVAIIGAIVLFLGIIFFLAEAD